MNIAWMLERASNGRQASGGSISLDAEPSALDTVILQRLMNAGQADRVESDIGCEQCRFRYEATS